jgi:RNA polymerase sigma factor (sigma-70 family)
MSEHRRPSAARPTGLQGDEAELYRKLHARLPASVSRAVNAPAATIEDACQTAWAILLRRQPDRGPTLFAWLRTVAIHEAYRLSGELRRLQLVSDVNTGPIATVADRRELHDAVEARRALRALAALPERQRRYLGLLVAGHHYDEIAEVAGATYTNVNKHLVKARRALRHAERYAA